MFTNGNNSRVIVYGRYLVAQLYVLLPQAHHDGAISFHSEI